MGCKEVVDPTANLPTLICIVEPKNENQKNYCLKLRDSFNYPNSIKYEIKAFVGSTFSITLQIKGQSYPIQTNFNENNETEISHALQTIYDKLDNAGNNPVAMPNIAQSTVPISMPNTIPTNITVPNNLTNTAPITVPNSDPNAFPVNVNVN